MYDFSGQLAVVTGGTRGLGAAMARAFLDAGARVVATYAADDARAAAFRDGLPDGHAERLALARFDVADGAACAAFWDGFEAAHGGAPHVLVNNAGLRRDAALALMREEDWRRVLDVNLTGVFHMCKGGVKLMASARYGRIVNVTSPGGRFGFEGQANYAASKAGMVGLTRSLSKEVAKRGITANCVSPGFIETDLLEGLPEDLAKEYRRQVPLKRFGRPEEVAHATLFLATREAAYITGTVLEVAGGL